MKRIIYIFLVISTLAVQVSFAQNCPGSPTYTNQSGTFDLTTGRSIVLNSGATFNITVSSDFSSTSSICVLNGSTLNLSFQNVNTIQKGGSIYTDKTSKLVFTGSNINNFPLTITNAGTATQSAALSFTDGATITNSGTYTISTIATLNSGTVTINNSGTMNITSTLQVNSGSFNITNTNTGYISFSNSLTLSNSTVTNAGTINYAGVVSLQSSSVITNNGYMNMQNSSTNSLVLSTSTVKNNGVLTTAGSILINSGSTLTNTCTIKDNSTFTNNGSVTNTGFILLGINSLLGTFLNQGPFVNGAAGFVQGTTFTNNNSITGGGNFYFTGVTTNQGTFAGTSSSNINFFDAGGTLLGKYFDVQLINPTYTTKNSIAANTATTFSSCVDVVVPVITIQPSSLVFCSSATTSASFSVTATSVVAPAYQWYKNGTPISGATASACTVTELTLADTANNYTVAVTNAIGSVTSSSASFKYLIITQPAPASLYLATGNAASFSGIKTSGALLFQWQKNGSSISGATSSAYSLPVVNYADSGNYTVQVSYSGGTCTSNTLVLKTSIILYSKTTGNLNLPATWGVATDGSGSSPIDFTREEHTFIVANRTSAETGGNLAIAGKLDVANSKVTITANTTLDAGRVVRSLTTGTLAGSATASLTVHGITTTAYAGASDLYFDKSNKTIKNIITSAHTVTLHTALNVTSGTSAGILQVNSGIFNTSDSLTLKSDSLGTGSVAKSLGTINGKVTIERFIHARRAYRFMGAPITATNAPTIHVAWQENAANSKDNPVPGYGTHITGGTEALGFDLNPQNTSSLKYISADGNVIWTGVANTSTTAVTQYPAYMFFIRGNRSYDISTTNNYTAPLTTTIRVTGNLNQGTQAAKTVLAKGYTTMVNPYAAPVNFAKILKAGTNVKNLIWVWDPTLAGNSGTGAWIIIDGSSGTYKTTPSSTYVTTVLQAGQGFLVQASDTTKTGTITFNEDEKDFTATTINADRTINNLATASLEVNLKVFNTDGTTATADGVLYHFGSGIKATKMLNFGENLGIRDGSSQYSITSRSLPAAGDSLALTIGNVKTTSYQLEFVPAAIKNVSFSLYDKYLNTLTPLSATDTTHITFSVTADAASRNASRFTIVTSAAKTSASLTASADNAVQATSKMSIYPNPLTGSTFTATFSNLAAGTYMLNIISANGTTLFSKSIIHIGGTASQKVIINNSLTAGMYYINITSAAKIISSVKVSVL